MCEGFDTKSKNSLINSEQTMVFRLSLRLWNGTTRKKTSKGSLKYNMNCYIYIIIWVLFAPETNISKFLHLFANFLSLKAQCLSVRLLTEYLNYFDNPLVKVHSSSLDSYLDSRYIVPYTLPMSLKVNKHFYDKTLNMITHGKYTLYVTLNL